MINLSQCKNLDLGLEPSFCLIYPFNLDKKIKLVCILESYLETKNIILHYINYLTVFKNHCYHLDFDLSWVIFVELI